MNEVLRIAKVCHAANKAFCEANGDFSRKDWDSTPTSLRQSSIDGVKKVLDNPRLTPMEMHANWMAFKKKQGWTYGEEKNLEKKTHPSMRPFSELPLDERRKDALFNAIVKALM